MPFQPGQSGNPAGKAPSQKQFATMLRLAINEAGKEPGTTKLRDVADALVSKAIDGDTQAIREIADRLDGKVPQGITGDPENPLHLAVSQIALVAPNLDNDRG